MDPGKSRGAGWATGATTTTQQTDKAASPRVTHPARRRMWTTRQVAELIELAFSTALHQARTGSLDALEREVQPFDERVATTARVLESSGGRR